jgi:hypothetical protein
MGAGKRWALPPEFWRLRQPEYYIEQRGNVKIPLESTGLFSSD